MRSDLARVRVRLFWWGDTTGRLVLIRTIDRRDTGTCEIWWSDQVTRHDVAATEFLLRPAQWQQLLTGTPVAYAGLPIPLYRLATDDDPDDQEAIGGAWERPDFHLLTSIHTLTQTGPESTVVIGADRPLLGTHELARLFRPSAGSASEAFAGLSAEAPAPRADYDVALSDVRGVVIGDDNQQINRFEVTVRDVDFDLRSVLARPGVRQAIAEVTMDPDDVGRRDALIAALSDPGWSVSWHPARLTVTDPGAPEAPGFLGSLLGFSFGVMVGDGGHQRNHFTYVTSSLPGVQDLLRGNQELARAVAGLVCPEGAATDTTSLLATVNSVVQDLPVDFRNNRVQGISLTPYAEMSLMHVDGAMVGEGNRQLNTVGVESAFVVGDFTMPRPPAFEAPSPGTELYEPFWPAETTTELDLDLPFRDTPPTPDEWDGHPGPGDRSLF
ncbi:hypothetical protein [Paractinoplanes maris]|uniref:hypothetical protein n=1 Tax=Paractinoplanes maris TaxID=1734446 RepID=UPI002021E01B|nr:hypothetical protein [Actinoplanes maris]